MKKLIAILIVVIASSAMAHTIRVGKLSYGGPGCPKGSIVVERDAESSSLNLQFDQYTVAAGAGDGKLGRKSCSLAIPVIVPKGLQLGVRAAAYSGFASLPEGAEARVSTEYFIAGNEGVLNTESYAGQLNEEINIVHVAPKDSILWTPCGAKTNIRVNTSVTVKSNESGEESVLNLNQASLIHLVIRQCSEDQAQSDI